MKFIALSILVFNLFSQTFAQTTTKEHFLLVGTYTNTGKSKGIYVYRFNAGLATAELVSTTASSNPSFLAVSPNHQFVYAVNEDNYGAISSYKFDNKTGGLSFINQQSTNGKHPCYVTVSKNGNWVVAGNYSSGNLSIFRSNLHGNLDSATSVYQHQGNGANKERQEAAHVHATVFSPDNKFLFVPDLGIDKLMAYSFNSQSGKLNAKTKWHINTKPGTGPRHFEFHPSGKYAYLIEELTGTISAYGYDKIKGLKLIQNISSLPNGFKGNIGSADIHVSTDGKFLYASNRGESNSIAIFRIDSLTGKIGLIGFQPTFGLTPRNFSIDPTGNLLLVANQNSDEIVIFKRNQKTGLLSDTGKRIAIGRPVCLKWIKAE